MFEVLVSIENIVLYDVITIIYFWRPYFFSLSECIEDFIKPLKSKSY
jgi:hypothetical protein